MIQIKRVYDDSEPSDGARFLVDRLWPRGVKKETLELRDWVKDIAPSAELRRWFGHDRDKWSEFRRLYRAELKQRPDTFEPLVNAAREGNVTLLYAARDREHNNAVVLAEYLEERIGR